MPIYQLQLDQNVISLELFSVSLTVDGRKFSLLIFVAEDLSQVFRTDLDVIVSTAGSLMVEVTCIRSM